MFTPPKAAPAIVGVLALAFFAGTTQAAATPRFALRKTDGAPNRTVNGCTWIARIRSATW